MCTVVIRVPESADDDVRILAIRDEDSIRVTALEDAELVLVDAI